MFTLKLEVKSRYSYRRREQEEDSPKIRLKINGPRSIDKLDELIQNQDYTISNAEEVVAEFGSEHSLERSSYYGEETVLNMIKCLEGTLYFQKTSLEDYKNNPEMSYDLLDNIKKLFNKETARHLIKFNKALKAIVTRKTGVELGIIGETLDGAKDGDKEAFRKIHKNIMVKYILENIKTFDSIEDLFLDIKSKSVSVNESEFDRAINTIMAEREFLNSVKDPKSVKMLIKKQSDIYGLSVPRELLSLKYNDLESSEVVRLEAFKLLLENDIVPDLITQTRNVDYISLIRIIGPLAEHLTEALEVIIVKMKSDPDEMNNWADSKSVLNLILSSASSGFLKVGERELESTILNDALVSYCAEEFNESDQLQYMFPKIYRKLVIYSESKSTRYNNTDRGAENKDIDFIDESLALQAIDSKESYRAKLEYLGQISKESLYKLVIAREEKIISRILGYQWTLDDGMTPNAEAPTFPAAHVQYMFSLITGYKEIGRDWDDQYDIQKKIVQILFSQTQRSVGYGGLSGFHSKKEIYSYIGSLFGDFDGVHQEMVRLHQEEKAMKKYITDATKEAGGLSAVKTLALKMPKRSRLKVIKGIEKSEYLEEVDFTDLEEFCDYIEKKPEVGVQARTITISGEKLPISLALKKAIEFNPELKNTIVESLFVVMGSRHAREDYHENLGEYFCLLLLRKILIDSNRLRSSDLRNIENLISMTSRDEAFRVFLDCLENPRTKTNWRQIEISGVTVLSFFDKKFEQPELEEIRKTVLVHYNIPDIHIDKELSYEDQDNSYFEAKASAEQETAAKEIKTLGLGRINIGDLNVDSFFEVKSKNFIEAARYALENPVLRDLTGFEMKDVEFYGIENCQEILKIIAEEDGHHLNVSSRDVLFESTLWPKEIFLKSFSYSKSKYYSEWSREGLSFYGVDPLSDLKALKEEDLDYWELISLGVPKKERIEIMLGEDNDYREFSGQVIRQIIRTAVIEEAVIEDINHLFEIPEADFLDKLNALVSHFGSREDRVYPSFYKKVKNLKISPEILKTAKDLWLENVKLGSLTDEELESFSKEEITEVVRNSKNAVLHASYKKFPKITDIIKNEILSRSKGDESKVSVKDENIATIVELFGSELLSKEIETNIDWDSNIPESEVDEVGRISVRWVFSNGPFKVFEGNIGTFAQGKFKFKEIIPKEVCNMIKKEVVKKSLAGTFEVIVKKNKEGPKSVIFKNERIGEFVSKYNLWVRYDDAFSEVFDEVKLTSVETRVRIEEGVVKVFNSNAIIEDIQKELKAKIEGLSNALSVAQKLTNEKIKVQINFQVNDAEYSSRNGLKESVKKGVIDSQSDRKTSRLGSSQMSKAQKDEWAVYQSGSSRYRSGEVYFSSPELKGNKGIEELGAVAKRVSLIDPLYIKSATLLVKNISKEQKEYLEESMDALSNSSPFAGSRCNISFEGKSAKISFHGRQITTRDLDKMDLFCIVLTEVLEKGTSTSSEAGKRSVLLERIAKAGSFSDLLEIKEMLAA